MDNEQNLATSDENQNDEPMVPENEPMVPERKVRLKFNGIGNEYFAIWIVNILLSVITLGIYSAWATVRTRRYFHNATEIDGFSLDFHANPITILKGRLIAFVLFTIYGFSVAFIPPLSIIMLLLFLGFLPWIVNRALKFYYRNTSYRNVRFDFVGTYKSSLWNFVVRPILCALPLYLLLPYDRNLADAYLVSHTKYGKQSFTSDASVGTYFLGAFIGALVAGAIAFIFVTILMAMEIEFIPNPYEVAPDFNSFFIFLALIYVSIVIGTLIYAAFRWKALVSTIQIRGMFKVNTDITVLQFLFSAIGALFLLLITLGLATPWVAVMFNRKLTESVTLTIVGDISSIVGEDLESGSALGSEAAEFGDIGII